MHSSKKTPQQPLATLYQNLDFNNQSGSLQKVIFNLDFYGNIKSVCQEWLRPHSVIRSLYNLECVKVTTQGKQNNFCTGVWFILAQELRTVLYLSWLNGLPAPSTSSAPCPKQLPLTQICSVLRCLLLAAKSWVQSQVISHASAWSPLWAVRLMFSVLGATVQVYSSLSLARGAPREQGPVPGISLGHEHSPTLQLVLSVQS